MPKGLVRYQQTGHLHFVTFSCYHRQPYLHTPKARTLFQHSLEATRQRHHFRVIGYVVMPEHVQLLLSEPQGGSTLSGTPLSKAIQALKLSVSVQSPERPFWQPRYYDFDVFSEAKRLESSTTCTTTPSPEALSPLAGAPHLPNESGRPGLAFKTWAR